MKNLIKNDVSILMSIHQRRDIELKFSSVIESIYKNTFIPKKFLLLIDGPINKNFEKSILKLKKKFNFEIYHHYKNIGLAKILNIGLKKINTKWVIRVDGDDINLPNRFQNLVENINPNISVIGSYTEEISNKKKTRIKKVPINNIQIKKFLKYRNPFNHNSVMYQVEHVLKVGGYPDLFLKEDYGLWVKLLSKKYYGLNIPEVLVQVSFNDDSYKRRSGFKYLKSDLELVRLQYQEKLINIIEFFILTLLRILYAILPQFSKKFLYDFLRSKT